MKKIIVAIGGGEIGRTGKMPDGTVMQYPVETMPIDKKIIRLSGKKNPKLLFIGTASGDAPGYFDTVKRHFGDTLGCLVSALNLVSGMPVAAEIKDAILGTDIIYVGGGNTLEMLKIWKAKGVDVLLRQAYEKGIILSGLSAGANIWFRHCSTDSAAVASGAEKGTMLGMMDCLGFLNGAFFPHVLREPLRRSSAEKILSSGQYPGETFYLSDDRSALVAIDDEIFGISADQNSFTRAMMFDKVFSYRILSAR